MSQSYKHISFKITVISIICSRFAYSLGFSGCDFSTKQGNVFIDLQLLKETEVFSDLSDAPKCQNETSCENYCNIQLRNVSVSNMLPCCVKRANSQQSVCQCVNALPLKNDSCNRNQCPTSNLKLVSTQIFSMSGITRFFNIGVPICGRLHSSWNIYSGTGPEIPTEAAPFLNGSGKSGFTFTRAYNKDGWYINYYAEFVTTCKTLLSFISDDLPLCTQKTCNVDLPNVTIVLDRDALNISNPKNAVFRNISSQNRCSATVQANNQCPASTKNRCDHETQPCCYSNRCMFPYIFDKDLCPCPPKDSDLVFANNFPLSCNLDNRLHLFNEESCPLVPQKFIWDFEPKPWRIDFDRILTGRTSIKSTVANANLTLHWFGEFRLDICVFAECLREVLRNLLPKQLPPIIGELLKLLISCSQKKFC